MLQCYGIPWRTCLQRLDTIPRYELQPGEVANFTTLRQHWCRFIWWTCEVGEEFNLLTTLPDPGIEPGTFHVQGESSRHELLPHLEYFKYFIYLSTYENYFHIYTNVSKEIYKVCPYPLIGGLFAKCCFVVWCVCHIMVCRLWHKSPLTKHMTTLHTIMTTHIYTCLLLAKTWQRAQNTLPLKTTN